MKILINTTPPTNKGGVANHYEGIKKYWSEDVYYNYIGGRKEIPGSIIILYDLLKFIFKCMVIKPKIVLLNPSLGRTALQRDRVYLKISKFLGNKTIVFFHGWNEEQAQEINENPKQFLNQFNRADAFLVLASAYREKLQRWGVTKPIKLTTTKVEDKLIEDFTIARKEFGKTLLFLARIERKKGIFIALKAFRKIIKHHPEANLVIAGSGTALMEAKEWVKEQGVKGVDFKGYIRGNELKYVFKKSDIYFFPTNYGEGMPTSVLEAMAFGLPVITRPVGGIVDFFENGKMGYIIDSLEPSNFAAKIIDILKDENKLKEISRFNNEYAKKHFLASKKAKQLEILFTQISTNSIISSHELGCQTL